MNRVDFTATMDNSIAGRVNLTNTVGDAKTNDFLTDSTDKCSVNSRVSLLVLWECVAHGEHHGDDQEDLYGG